MSTSLLPRLSTYAQTLIAEADQIPPERKSRLRKLADYVYERADDVAALTFICTHNSRRSQLAQVWAAVAAHHFGLDHVRTYSGGTEVTAFNPYAVAALERADFALKFRMGRIRTTVLTSHLRPRPWNAGPRPTTIPPIRNVTLPPS